MGEHYTRGTKECTVWCNKCGRLTQHRVDDVRRGPCLECLAKQEELIRTTVGWSKAQLKRREKAEQTRQNPTLF